MKTFAKVWLLTLLIAPLPIAADSVEDEVRAAVEEYYAAMRRDLVDSRQMMSDEGVVQFWSSGGLMLSASKAGPGTAYDSFNVHPKHIEVVSLSETSAAVLYYAEGSMTPKGSEPVARYLTRVLEVFVKEDGAWKQRAGHWSPLRGGGGTSRSAD